MESIQTSRTRAYLSMHPQCPACSQTYILHLFKSFFVATARNRGAESTQQGPPAEGLKPSKNLAVYGPRTDVV